MAEEHEKTKKPKRKSPERTGPIVRREMTQVRDELGEIRNLVRQLDLTEAEGRLDVLYSKLDKLDLRFHQHHDGEKKAK